MQCSTFICACNIKHILGSQVLIPERGCCHHYLANIFPFLPFDRVENRVRKAVILPIYWKYAVGEIVNTTMSLCACVHLFTDLWLI